MYNHWTLVLLTVAINYMYSVTLEHLFCLTADWMNNVLPPSRLCYTAKSGHHEQVYRHRAAPEAAGFLSTMTVAITNTLQVNGSWCLV